MNVALLVESRADLPGTKQVWKQVIISGNRAIIFNPYGIDFCEPNLDTVSSLNKLKSIKLDWFVVLGDRKRVLLQTINAKESGIKIAHISGGDKQNAKLLDEPCRYSISLFSDIHFTTNRKSDARLKAFLSSVGRRDKVIMSGSPYVDAILDFKPMARKNKDEYVVILINPEPDYRSLYSYLFDYYKKVKYDVVFVEPNADYGIKEKDDLVNEIKKRGFTYTNNLDQTAFLNLVWHSKYFLGNSSAMLLELQYLGIPCISVGDRNTGREEAFPGELMRLEPLKLFMSNRLDNLYKATEKTDKRSKKGLREDYSHGAFGKGKASEIIVNNLIRNRRKS